MKITPDSDKIKRWREERHWSQEHLAAIAGVSLRTVQRIENGDRVSAETLMALAAAFNVEATALNADLSRTSEMIAQTRRRDSVAALRLSFMIHLLGYLVGMLVFMTISLTDGVPGFAMLESGLWWTVGLAGHGFVLGLLIVIDHFEQSRADQI